MLADLIDLDDRAYTDLVAEARAIIPSLTPTWTDFNESDPGIALVELFAWLTEILCYRFNHVTDDSYWTFLRLLNEPGWQPGSADLATAIRETVALVRGRDRAITRDDFQYLILEKWPASPEAAAAIPSLTAADAITRIRIVPDVALGSVNVAPQLPPQTVLGLFRDIADVAAPGDVSVVLLGPGGAPLPPLSGVWSGLAAFLDPRRLLTMHVHLCQPRSAMVAVSAHLHLRADGDPTAVPAQAESALSAFVHPLTGGRDGTGWPFGRDLFLSDVYELLGRIDAIDFVDGVALAVQAAPDRALADGSGVRLGDLELVALTFNFTVTVGS